jgi:hypothetical protein
MAKIVQSEAPEPCRYANLAPHLLKANDWSISPARWKYPDGISVLFQSFEQDDRFVADRNIAGSNLGMLKPQKALSVRFGTE